MSGQERPGAGRTGRTHHGVLLALDGGRDGLHVGTATAGKRGQQQLVLDGHIAVEVGNQRVFFDFKLAAQLQIHVDGAPIGNIGGGTHSLVVVHLGHGTAPVNDEAPIVLIRDARRANVQLLGRLTGLELQHNLREIRLAQQYFHGAQTFGLHRVRHVVGLDDVVHSHDVGMGFQDVVPGGEVHSQLVGHVLLILRRLSRHGLHGSQRITADFLQLAVGFRQVRLLGGEHRIPSQLLNLLGNVNRCPVLFRRARQGCPRSDRSYAARPGRSCPPASSCAAPACHRPADHRRRESTRSGSPPTAPRATGTPRPRYRA